MPPIAKKALIWLVVIGLAWYLITNPTGAANAVTGVIGAAKTIGGALSTFFTTLSHN